jgi:serine/threonine-protein kinase
LNELHVGQIILGKWRLDRCLGQGGMGTVFLARELSIDREVALKFPHPSLVALDEYRSRFEREARVMAQVEHPNLVTLYSIEHDGSSPFLVLKFVPGKTLCKVRGAGPMPVNEAMPLVLQMAAALLALHSRGFVHRDLKPSNVMVEPDGHVTVLDFGLTRSAAQDLTRPGVTHGSPQYMSPEQVMGSTLDGRSDLYSLALVTSELLVGHRPYGDEAGPQLLQHLEAEPEPAHVGNPALPEAVSSVLLKALRKRPADRFATVTAFAEALVRAAEVDAPQLPRRHTAEAMLVAGRNAAKAAAVPAPESMAQTLDDPSMASGPRWTQTLNAPAEQRTVPSRAAHPAPSTSDDVITAVLRDSSEPRAAQRRTPLEATATRGEVSEGTDVVMAPTLARRALGPVPATEGLPPAQEVPTAPGRGSSPSSITLDERRPAASPKGVTTTPALRGVKRRRPIRRS